jgi:hypothetical protein
MRKVDRKVARMEQMENAACAEFKLEIIKTRILLGHSELDVVTVLGRV